MSSPASYSTPPAYQFYINEWRSSRAVQRMTWAQRGMYREMLDEQWQKGSLPDCPAAVADALGGTVEEWTAAWPALRRKFVDRRSRPRPGDVEIHDPTDCDPRRQIINLRLERLRRERKHFISGRQNAGRAGGASKARKAKELSASTATANPSNGVANPSSSSSSSTASTSSSESSTSSPSSAPVLAEKAEQRSNRPIFKGQRLVVFDWMLDNLRQMLGSHFDAFDVHEWFYELDAKVEAANLVLPKRDGGKWLEDQTLSEAIRRGLPIAVAAVPQSGKTAGNLGNLQRFMAKGRV